MNQNKRLDYLIQMLRTEQPRFQEIRVPDDTAGKQQCLRSLMNLRTPMPISKEFLRVQDDYLQEQLRDRTITDINDLRPLRDNLYLWQGDITTLAVDAIVNAANSALLGCFAPCHGCIDNAIHTYAGVQLRLACNELMQQQGSPEPTGTAKITDAFNLPCRYVLHTVGPIISGRLTQQDCDLLAACYRSCLELAESHGVQSIAFCCISTGEFHFPNGEAATIAVQTVQQFLEEHNSTTIKVVFNVFKDYDYEIYKHLLTI